MPKILTFPWRNIFLRAENEEECHRDEFDIRGHPLMTSIQYRGIIGPGDYQKVDYTSRKLLLINELIRGKGFKKS